MDLKLIKRQVDSLRAIASQETATPSSVIFAITNPIMDEFEREPDSHSCCGFPTSGGHNGSCTFYGLDEQVDKEG